MKNWKIKNNTVMLDEFHKGKAKVPVNRHRIPDVGDDHNKEKDKPKQFKLSPNSEYIWTLDGRRIKRPKKKAG